MSSFDETLDEEAQRRNAEVFGDDNAQRRRAALGVVETWLHTAKRGAELRIDDADVFVVLALKVSRLANNAFLQNIEIADAHRRRGVARAVVRLLKQWAASKSGGTVTIQSVQSPHMEALARNEEFTPAQATGSWIWPR